MPQTHTNTALVLAGIAPIDAKALRNISARLQHWHELECGTEAHGDRMITESVEREQGACVLTEENMHTADDCSLHHHEDGEPFFVRRGHFPTCGGKRGPYEVRRLSYVDYEKTL